VKKLFVFHFIITEHSFLFLVLTALQY